MRASPIEKALISWHNVEMDDVGSAVRAFVLRVWGEAPHLPRDLTNQSDIFARLGIDGDDAFEFIDEFAREFDVDVSDYRWYFHHGEEGLGLGGIFFSPPYRRVKPIPITFDDLIRAVETRKWPIEYPEHTLPSVRWDLRFNQVFGLLIAAVLVVWLWRRFVP